MASSLLQNGLLERAAGCARGCLDPHGRHKPTEGMRLPPSIFGPLAIAAWDLATRTSTSLKWPECGGIGPISVKIGPLLVRNGPNRAFRSAHLLHRPSRGPDRSSTRSALSHERGGLGPESGKTGPFLSIWWQSSRDTTLHGPSLPGYGAPNLGPFRPCWGHFRPILGHFWPVLALPGRKGSAPS